jgi:hypothetical protein
MGKRAVQPEKIFPSQFIFRCCKRNFDNKERGHDDYDIKGTGSEAF